MLLLLTLSSVGIFGRKQGLAGSLADEALVESLQKQVAELQKKLQAQRAKTAESKTKCDNFVEKLQLRNEANLKNCRGRVASAKPSEVPQVQPGPVFSTRTKLKAGERMPFFGEQFPAFVEIDTGQNAGEMTLTSFNQDILRGDMSHCRHFDVLFQSMRSRDTRCLAIVHTEEYWADKGFLLSYSQNYTASKEAKKNGPPQELPYFAVEDAPIPGRQYSYYTDKVSRRLVG
jgi:hypothetical protein